MTARFRIPLVLVLLTAAVALLLCGPDATDEVPSDVTRKAATAEVPALRDAQPTEEATPEDPTLKGRTMREEGEGVERGVRVIVRSKAGLRVPGVGVTATWPGGGDGPRRLVKATTASDGSAFLPGIPLDGSAHVSVEAVATAPETQLIGGIAVTSSELVVTIDEGLPLFVRCVDDLTGQELRDAVVRGRTPRPTPDGGILELVRPNDTDVVAFIVEAPRGFVAWERMFQVVAIGAWTRELEAVYPLRHEAEVRVTVLSHEGVPESRATLDGFRIAGRPGSTDRAERVGPGAFRLRGVPFFRYVVLSVTASAPDLQTGTLESVRLGAHPTDRVELTIVLPPPGAESAVSDSTIGIGGGAGGAFGGRGSRGPTGEAHVVVLRRDGSPASHVRVRVGRRTVTTDAEGNARITDLRVGEHEVVVHAIGLLPVGGVVRVEEGSVTRLDLTEPEGGAIDVRVVDPQGDPLPFAALTVRTPSKGAWVDERDGYQRIDPYTDHLGRRRLEHIEVGRIVVHARWGGLKAQEEIEIREGRLANMTIVLE